MDIVISETLIVAATVILSFIVNQALIWAGVEMSETAKKLVVFVAAVGLAGYSAHRGYVPTFGDDPMALALGLVGNAGLVFKAAQPVYDRLWKSLLAAK